MSRRQPVTPDNAPNRFTKDEKALFKDGKCSQSTEYGNGGPTVHCGQPSKTGADFGDCAGHVEDRKANGR